MSVVSFSKISQCSFIVPAQHFSPFLTDTSSAALNPRHSVTEVAFLIPIVKEMFKFAFLSASPSVTRGCWWSLRQYKTAVCTKWPVVTGTTACLSSVGSIHGRKRCCSAQEASTARAWWDCSSRRTPPQQVCTHTHFNTA